MSSPSNLTPFTLSPQCATPARPSTSGTGRASPSPTRTPTASRAAAAAAAPAATATGRCMGGSGRGTSRPSCPRGRTSTAQRVTPRPGPRRRPGRRRCGILERYPISRDILNEFHVTESDAAAPKTRPSFHFNGGTWRGRLDAKLQFVCCVCLCRAFRLRPFLPPSRDAS